MAKILTDDHVTFLGILSIKPFDPIYICLSNICNFNTHSILSQELSLHLSPYLKMYSYSKLYLDVCLCPHRIVLCGLELDILDILTHINSSS